MIQHNVIANEPTGESVALDEHGIRLVFRMIWKSLAI
jgi:hypothetical protein